MMTRGWGEGSKVGEQQGRRTTKAGIVASLTLVLQPFKQPEDIEEAQTNTP